MPSRTVDRQIRASLVVLSLLVVAPVTAMAGTKVQVCHVPPDDPENFHTITISEKALGAHLDHGDLAGSCDAFCSWLCDDGDACTVDDGTDCAVEGCPADRSVVDCDDGNGCTIDSCVPTLGCMYTALPCPDVPCMVGSCDPVSGGCDYVPVLCAPGTACDPATNECIGTLCDPACDDNTQECVDGACVDVPGAIEGTVWFDQDGDGVRIAGEDGVAGLTVGLYADGDNDGLPDGAAVSMTPTASDGDYSFGDLLGAFVVRAFPPSGCQTSGPDSVIDPLTDYTFTVMVLAANPPHVVSGVDIGVSFVCP